jgi:hypothetical protein
MFIDFGLNFAEPFDLTFVEIIQTQEIIVMAFDLSAQHITLTPELTSGAIKLRIENTQDRINEALGGQDGLNDAVETALNDLQGQLTTLTGGDISTMLTEIQNLQDVLSQAGAANDVLDALTIIKTDLNNDRIATELVESTMISAIGTIALDLTAYGFSAVSDYKVSVSSNGLSALRASVGVDKTSATSATITAYDKAYLVEDGQVYDASTNNLDLTVTISYDKDAVAFTTDNVLP